MIRRLLWISLGAALGIAGYRRAAMILRSATVAPWRRREPGGFISDVRDGMAVYWERHPPRVSSTLGNQRGNGPASDGPAGRPRTRQ